MSRPRVLLIVLLALLAGALAACNPAVLAPAATPTPIATATPAPPTATPLPTPTPTPALPDPKIDPMAALLYISQPDRMRSAEFTYLMQMDLQPADDASAQALESVLPQIRESLGEMKGQGALQIIDSSSGAVNMRMALDMQIAGQQYTVETILIDGQAWVRLGPDQEWQKSEEPAVSLSPGMDPTSLGEMVRSATDVRWIKETELDAEKVHILRYTLDPAKFDFGALLASSGAGQLDQEQLQAMLQEMKVQADLWLRASDLMVLKQQMALSAPLPLPAETGMEGVTLLMDIDMTMHYSRINEPVTIEAPEP